MRKISIVLMVFAISPLSLKAQPIGDFAHHYYNKAHILLEIRESYDYYFKDTIIPDSIKKLRSKILKDNLNDIIDCLDNVCDYGPKDQICLFSKSDAAIVAFENNWIGVAQSRIEDILFGFTLEKKRYRFNENKDPFTFLEARKMLAKIKIRDGGFEFADELLKEIRKFKRRWSCGQGASGHHEEVMLLDYRFYTSQNKHKEAFEALLPYAVKGYMADSVIKSLNLAGLEKETFYKLDSASKNLVFKNDDYYVKYDNKLFRLKSPYSKNEREYPGSFRQHFIQSELYIRLKAIVEGN